MDRGWRPLCARGLYPFTDGSVIDFDPVFTELITTSGDDPAVLTRPDDYAAPFLPVAGKLVTTAEQAEAAGDLATARETYLRAATVYRIARFPINRSPRSQDAWERGKAAYEKGGRLLDPPNVPVTIAFRHADPTAGDDTGDIPAYVRIPRAPTRRPVAGRAVHLRTRRLPHRPHTTNPAARSARPATSIQIPEPAPAPPPRRPGLDRPAGQSVLDWIAADPDQHGFDPSAVIARGVSTGGYHSFRAAHTHAGRLLGAVAQGGGSHHMFDPAWIRAQNRMEYPFALADALAYKFGYRDPDPDIARERYAADAHRFSLVAAGLVGSPTCRLLAINGMEDSIFPVEDTLLVAAPGRDKDLIARGDRAHRQSGSRKNCL